MSTKPDPRFDYLPKIRCKNCGKVLMEGRITLGIIKKNCDKCRTVNVVTANGIEEEERAVA